MEVECQGCTGLRLVYVTLCARLSVWGTVTPAMRETRV